LISSQHPEASIQAVFSDAQMHIWALEGKQFLFPALVPDFGVSVKALTLF